jgi:hypothetical protein
VNFKVKLIVSFEPKQIRKMIVEEFNTSVFSNSVIDESGDFNVPSVSQDVKPKRETAFGKKKVSLAEQLNRKKPFTKLHQEQAVIKAKYLLFHF